MIGANYPYTRGSDVWPHARVRCTVIDSYGGGFLWQVRNDDGTYAEFRQLFWDPANGVSLKLVERVPYVAAKLAAISAEYGITGWVVDKLNGWLCDVDDMWLNTACYRRKQTFGLCLETQANSNVCARPIYDEHADMCSMHAKRAATEATLHLKRQQELLAQRAVQEANDAVREQVLTDLRARWFHAADVMGFAHDDVRINESRQVYVNLDIFLALCDRVAGFAHVQTITDVAVAEFTQAQPEPEPDDRPVAGTIVSPW